MTTLQFRMIYQLLLDILWAACNPNDKKNYTAYCRHADNYVEWLEANKALIEAENKISNWVEGSNGE